MAQFRSQFLQKLQARGLIHQCSNLDALDRIAAEERIVAYIGFDCTAPSLHAGSLLPIMLLKILQQTGHKPIILMGGGTSKIGDPSGRDAARNLLDAETIAGNMENLKKVFSRFVTFGSGQGDAVMVDNAAWLDQLCYIDFLREYGRHFSVNRMLSFDSVRTRLAREQPLSFLEFNYMLMQAYDFMELNQRFGCILQMGGSDQWGNITAGIELTRRVRSMGVHALTCPLLTTATGAKMGKTAQGAIWLDEKYLPDYEYWQYWRNRPDEEIANLLRLLTECDQEMIVDLCQGDHCDINQAKKVLANALTTLTRGAEAAKKAEARAEIAFSQTGVEEGLPVIAPMGEEVTKGASIIAFLRRAGFAQSNSQAHRLLQAGGVRLDGKVIRDSGYVIAPASRKTSFFPPAKKRHVLIDWREED